MKVCQATATDRQRRKRLFLCTNTKGRESSKRCLLAGTARQSGALQLVIKLRDRSKLSHSLRLFLFLVFLVSFRQPRLLTYSQWQGAQRDLMYSFRITRNAVLAEQLHLFFCLAPAFQVVCALLTFWHFVGEFVRVEIVLAWLFLLNEDQLNLILPFFFLFLREYFRRNFITLENIYQ